MINIFQPQVDTECQNKELVFEEICKSNIAAMQENVSICLDLQRNLSKQRCFADVALVSGTTSYCDYINVSTQEKGDLFNASQKRYLCYLEISRNLNMGEAPFGGVLPCTQ